MHQGYGRRVKRQRLRSRGRETSREDIKKKKKKKGAGQWSLDSTLHTPGGRRNPVGTEQVVCLIAWLSGCLAVWVGIAMSTGSSVAQGANPQSLSDWALPDCVVGELEYIGDSRKGVSIRRPGKELGRQCHEECECESLSSKDLQGASLTKN